ncbi:HlyD family type I secretion periplasmic adaptor subunit [Chitinivorax sp. B]|uniref:HlyD family type I secretion periplasmic adaptor subunit n=1 Tax=Chitinivorax sp. B TaxID=2502235 RepID=UPI0010F50ED3|nr:HlyD family type I secretion periplasmic adaptor subunit [Chitinivorax sp. B]
MFTASPRLQAWRELLKRYAAVWQAAWVVRDELAPQARLPHEAQFLPAALELQDTPPSPIPRWTAYTLMTLFVISLLWACFGKMDIVAVAQGKIVPSDRVKVIQPLETARIQRILVSEGQSVTAGQTLIELDTTETGAEHDKTRKAWQDAQLQTRRTRHLLDALDRGTLSALPTQAEIPQEALDNAQRLMQSQYAEYQARLATLAADLSRRQAEQDSTRALVSKLEQTLPIATQRAEDYRKLVDQHFVSKHGYLEQEQARIEREKDLASARSKLRELQAAIAENQKQRVSLTAEFRKTLLTELTAAEQQGAALQEELIKTGNRAQLRTLTAPVAGTVQQLAVHTVGGVVTEAQPLMVIVPKDNPLEIEAWVDNKDIGFVYADQPATVKIETFNYTKYGTLKGKVLTVSDDAIADEKYGLRYHARIRLDQTRIKLESKEVNLSPGMAVSVEIKTGQRRLIEYFLSPLMEYGSESLRER